MHKELLEIKIIMTEISRTKSRVKRDGKEKRKLKGQCDLMYNPVIENEKGEESYQ